MGIRIWVLVLALVLPEAQAFSGLGAGVLGTQGWKGSSLRCSGPKTLCNGELISSGPLLSGSSAPRLHRAPALSAPSMSSGAGLVMTDVEALQAAPVGQATILVAGGTGRVGSQVVIELLNRNPNCRIVVPTRDVERANEVLADALKTAGTVAGESRLKIVKCNLKRLDQMTEVMQGVNQVMWCATAFGTRGSSGPFRLFRIAKFWFSSKLGRVLDIRGPQRIAELLKDQAPPALSKDPTISTMFRDNKLGPPGTVPRIVILSSAAVTRPSWSEEKKAEFPEAAEIPIVKLNPLNILGTKLRAENNVRNSGIPYTVVRSCGISSEQEPGEFMISSGDTAVGRINPKDLGVALATILNLADATGKTVELYTSNERLWRAGGVKQQLQSQISEVYPDAFTR